MDNYDPQNQKSIASFILKMLPRHELMAIATVDGRSKPWVVCVNMSYDQEINLIWKSAKEAEHSKNIRQNSAVSVCIFSRSDDVGDFGFYCRGKASELNDESEIKRILATKYEAKDLPVPPSSDFQGDARLRLYQVEIVEAWINDDRHIKTTVDLEMLRSSAATTN